MKTTLFIIMCIVTSSLMAEDRVFLSIENKKPEVGDDIVLNIQCTTKNNSFVVFPDYSDYLKPLEVIPPIEYDTFPKGRNTMYACTIHLRAWDSTLVKIPALPIIIDNNATVDTLYTLSQNLPVSMIYADTTKPIKDIYPPIYKEVSSAQKLQHFFKTFRWVLLAILLVGFIVALIFFMDKRNKKIKRATHFIPKGVSPYQWCMHHIPIAEAMTDVSKRYGRLSEILRLYLEYKYALPTLSHTTGEIIPILESSAIPTLYRAQIIQFLNTCDGYKFLPNNTVISNADMPLNTLIQKLEKNALG